MKKDIWIFVDGGARLKVKGDYDSGFHGSYAFVSTFAIDGELKRFTSGGGFVKDTTTPRMEFSALASALKNTNLVLDEPELCDVYGETEGGTIYIVCDAMNTVKTMTDWIHKWIALTIKKFGSIFKKGGSSEEVEIFRKEREKYVPVLNQDLIIQILRSLDIFVARKMTIKFLHIKSHIPQKDLETSWVKFQDFNNMSIGMKEFMELVKYNEEVDSLVQKYYEIGLQRLSNVKIPQTIEDKEENN